MLHACVCTCVYVRVHVCVCTHACVCMRACVRACETPTIQEASVGAEGEGREGGEEVREGDR